MVPVIIVSVIVGTAWIFFPIFIWSQLRQVITLLRQIRDASERIGDNTRGAPGTPVEQTRYSAATYDPESSGGYAIVFAVLLIVALVIVYIATH